MAVEEDEEAEAEVEVVVKEEKAEVIERRSSALLNTPPCRRARPRAPCYAPPWGGSPG